MTEQDGTNWRSVVSTEDRLTVIKHIFRKLQTYAPDLPEETLQERTRQFEDAAFRTASNRQHYLTHIAAALSKIEVASGSQSNSTQQPANVQSQQASANVQQQNSLQQQQQQMQQLQQQSTDQQQARFNAQRRQMIAQQIQHQQQQQQQQQQIQAQARQMVMQEQNAVKTNQEDPHKPTQAQKRAQNAINDSKKKNNASVNKTASQLSGAAAVAQGKQRTNNNPSVSETEPYMRMPVDPNKAAAFSAAQAHPNGMPNSNEVMMTLAQHPGQRVHGLHMMQGVDAQNPQAGIQQPHQVQHSLQQGSMIPEGLNVSQALAQQRVSSQQAINATAAASTQPMIGASQGLQRHAMNANPGQGVLGMGNISRVETQQAILMILENSGFSLTLEQFQNLPPEKRQHLQNYAMKRTAGFTPAQLRAVIARRASESQNARSRPISNTAQVGAAGANWMGQMDNMSGSANMNSKNSHAITHALAIEKQKQMQQAQGQQFAPSAAQLSAAQRKLNVANSATAGVTVPQMNALLESQKRHENSVASQQEKLSAAGMQKASRTRSSQSIGSNPSSFTGNMPRTSAAGSSAVAVNVAAMSGARPPTANGNDAEFWKKLKDMQMKYKQPLKRLYPYLSQLQSQPGNNNTQTLVKHVGECMKILNLSPKGQPLSQNVTIEVLERAEKFIHRVIGAYRNVPSASQQPGNPAAKDGVMGRIDGSAGRAGPGQHSMQQMKAMQRPGPHLATRLAQQGVKAEPNLSTAARLQLENPQSQQHIAQIRKQMLQMQDLKARQQVAPQSMGAEKGGLPMGMDPKLLGKQPNMKGNLPRQQAKRMQKTTQALRGQQPGPSVIQNPAQGRVESQVEQQVNAEVRAQVHNQAQAQIAAETAAGHTQIHPNMQSQNVINAQLKGQRMAQRPGQVMRTQKGAPIIQQMRQQGVRHRASVGMPNVTKQQLQAWPDGAAMPPNAINSVQRQAVQKKPELDLQQHLAHLMKTIKDAGDNASRTEHYLEGEMKRAKSERIHTTLAALRNNTSAGTTANGGENPKKRPSSLVDVENYNDQNGSIKTNTVFECSSDVGLRLAKKPKNEAADLRSLREAVEIDCKAAKDSNPLLMIEIIEEFGQPVVTALLNIPEIRLPKLVLRVQRGYPRKGGANYGFERPPLGWVGVMEDIRSKFKRSLATAPSVSIGVAAFLNAWARAADVVINGSKLSESR